MSDNVCRGSDEMGSDYTHLRKSEKTTNVVQVVPMLEDVSLGGRWTLVIVNGWNAAYFRSEIDANMFADAIRTGPLRHTATPSIYSR